MTLGFMIDLLAVATASRRRGHRRWAQQPFGGYIAMTADGGSPKHSGEEPLRHRLPTTRFPAAA
jgi:hypothetical protein